MGGGSPQAVKRRRKHSPAYKREVLEACDQPGQSVAAVAQRYQINANLVHRWRRALKQPSSTQQNDFMRVPVPMPMPVQPVPVMQGVVKVEVPSPKGAIVIHWPANQIDHLAHWLGTVLA